MDDWQSFFSEEEFVELVTTQVANAHAALQKLKEAVEARQYSDIKSWAHNLKSGCGALGLIRVQSVAKEFEHACRVGCHEEALV